MVFRHSGKYTFPFLLFFYVCLSLTLTVYYHNNTSPHLVCLVLCFFTVLTKEAWQSLTLPDILSFQDVRNTEWFLTLTRRVMGKPAWNLWKAAQFGLINDSPSYMLLAEKLGWPVSVHYTTATDHEKPWQDICILIRLGLIDHKTWSSTVSFVSTVRTRALNSE